MSICCSGAQELAHQDCRPKLGLAHHAVHDNPLPHDSSECTLPAGKDRVRKEGNPEP